MFRWDPQFETGHPGIDAEHREFIRLLNELEASIVLQPSHERVTQLITILEQYANGHFRREEAHMECMGCPARHANCAAHREFSRKLAGWVELLQSGIVTPASLLSDVHHASAAWIETHILSIDRQLRFSPPAAGDS